MGKYYVPFNNVKKMKSLISDFLLIKIKSSYETNSVAQYKRDRSQALMYDSSLGLCEKLPLTAATKMCSEGIYMNETSYLEELRKHRFVASPSGRSLDSYFTWEALLSGCIPIIPRSELEPMFENLPVLIIDDWGEVDDTFIQKKAKELASKTYSWDKLFADWWRKEIHSGLCISHDNKVQTDNSDLFESLPGPELETKNIDDLVPVEEGKHFKIPPPNDRVGPNGEKGYIHDPTFMKKHSRSFQIIEPEIVCAPPGEGFEGFLGYNNLKRIRSHLDAQRLQSEISRAQDDQSEIKLMCAVYTHEGAVNQTNAIWETWGKRCDGSLFASSISNLTTGHMHMPNYSPVEHEYRGIWQKVRTLMAYLYDHFLEDYDFFHILGDDVYLIVENLKEFLASPEVQSFERDDQQNLFYAGEWLSWGEDLDSPFFNYYMGGGSGYTLSKRALKAFVEGPLEDIEAGSMMRASAEDRIVSHLFRTHLNVTGVDTRDGRGAHRYHQSSVKCASDWLHNERGMRLAIHLQSLDASLRWRGFPVDLSTDFVSSSSVAFHLAQPDIMRRYEMVLYGTGVDLCQNRTAS